jgi:Tol biopolymer transport system component
VTAGRAAVLLLIAAPLLSWSGQQAPVPASQLALAGVPYRIIYETLRESGGRANWELFIINADGSGMTNLTNTPDLDEHYPHASPDGTQILFIAMQRQGRRVQSRAAYVMNLDGTGRIKIADNAYQPTWANGGRAIAYLPGEFSRANASMTSNRGLAVYDLATRTTRTHQADDLRMLYNLTASPDGRWFVATTRDGRRSNLLFSSEGRTVRPLSIEGCRPDISADGTRIAWGRTDHELRIGTFNAAASRNVVDQQPVVAVGRSQKVYHVDWSPDGRHLAFSFGSARGNQAVGERAPGWNLAVYDIAARRWAPITSDGHHNKEPDWVPVR